MPSPQQALKQYFGFDHFRDGQEEVIQRTLAGKNTLLVMPTGSGKSLAYQLPAQLLPGLTLVISPLIALMKDQVDSLTETGITATFINSTLPSHEVNRRMRATLEGDVKLLYVAPERLRNRQFMQSLARLKISLLAVDEAHCISQWGHDFRPDYLQIGPTWQAMGKPPLLATTATATDKVRRDVLKILGLNKTHTIVTGFNRPNLTFRVSHTPDTNTRFQALKALLKKLDGGSAIVYAATRRNTEEAAEFLRVTLGVAAQAYHAGMHKDARYQTQTDFMRDKLKIVVATNAFGMGVDKPDVRQVVHYNMPSTIEAYYQEAGRAGRDGLPAECVLLYSPDDQRLQEWMITSDTPSYEDLQQIYTLLYYSATDNAVQISRNELAENAGLHPVKLRVTLNELELAGGLYHLGTQGSFDSWKILPLTDEAIEQRVEAIERRAKIRFGLLQSMLAYTHLTTCRREFLLTYFGDETPPKSPNCCDNHREDVIADLPKAVTPQEWYPLIILETVRGLGAKAGRSLLAKILTGSQERRMQQFGYNKHKFYGKLERLKRKDVTRLIDEMIQDRYLKLTLVSGQMRKFSVVDITPLGLEALQARAALPLKIDNLPSPTRVSGRKRTKLDTVEETYKRFIAGDSIEEIAAERSLSENTIYTHLAKLIEQGRVDLADVTPDDVEAQVLDAVKIVGTTYRLAPINDILPEEISYGHIRCVIAAHPELRQNDLTLEQTETLEQRVVILGASGNPVHIPEVVVALQDDNGNVRRLAASALGKIGDADAVEPLLALLESETKPQVRQCAIKALGRIGDPLAHSLLENIAASGNEKEYNIQAAQTALSNLSKRQPTSSQLAQQPPNPPISPAHPPTRLPAHLPTRSSAPVSPDSPDQIVLEAVAKLNGALGRTGLAQLLTGSKAKWLETFAEHSYYGKLHIFTHQAILDIIDALISDNLLKLIGGFRPKVVLPDQVGETSGQGQGQGEGRKKEETKDAGAKEAVYSSAAGKQPNQAVLEALREWRTEQAKTQGKPPYVIFPNKVLESIAAQCPVTLDAFGEISGVGPVKLERYGEAVIAIVSRFFRDAYSQPPGNYKSPLSEKAPAPYSTSSDGAQAKNPQEAVLAVVSDLEGLLTPNGIALLLTSRPGDIVPFSDHALFGKFNNLMGGTEIEQVVQQLIQEKKLLLNRYKRVTLPGVG